jgi:drug/metabolite transporter (DMT)-like permease
MGEFRRMSRPDRFKLSGAVISGGVIAPLCLTYGIKYGTAIEVTLLLNLETVATTLISRLIFKEYIGLRLWVGKFLILAGAFFIILQPKGEPHLSLSGLLVVFACIFWGVDNNLTREVVELPATVLASVKGLSAGIFNTLLALVFFPGRVTGLQISGALTIGALCYGLSLVLFVEALRKIGSARTSTFFAVGPFIGTLLSVVVLGEQPPALFWFATLLMMSGVFFLYREKHRHLHTHESVTHTHIHIQDEHHQHVHEGMDISEPHDHIHTHGPITHIHGHWPDIHHRHRHQEEKNNDVKTAT